MKKTLTLIACSLIYYSCSSDKPKVQVTTVPEPTPIVEKQPEPKPEQSVNKPTPQVQKVVKQPKEAQVFETIRTLPKERFASDVQQVIESHNYDIQQLFLQYKRTDPTLKGTINFEIAILTNGKVNQIDVVQKNIMNESFIRALQSRIRTWKFPEIDETAKVEKMKVPYSF